MVKILTITMTILIVTKKILIVTKKILIVTISQGQIRVPISRGRSIELKFQDQLDATELYGSTISDFNLTYFIVSYRRKTYTVLSTRQQIIRQLFSVTQSDFIGSFWFFVFVLMYLRSVIEKTRNLPMFDKTCKTTCEKWV